jgi:hypothetical protein
VISVTFWQSCAESSDLLLLSETETSQDEPSGSEIVSHRRQVSVLLTPIAESPQLLGLGHLGQAYAWTLGMLPYARPGEVQLGLVDFDRIIGANTAPQLLVTFTLRGTSQQSS